MGGMVKPSVFPIPPGSATLARPAITLILADISKKMQVRHVVD
jgi:hypothetical protein